MEQESRSNGADATSSKQAADNTSRIKSVHISGLLALKGAPVEKTVVPSSAMPAKIDAMSALSAKIDAMDTGVPSRAPSSASEFSTPSVADSVEFTETNPAGVIDKQAPAKDQQAPAIDQDIDMPDAAGAEPMEEISTGGTSSVAPNQVCVVLICWYYFVPGTNILVLICTRY